MFCLIKKTKINFQNYLLSKTQPGSIEKKKRNVNYFVCFRKKNKKNHFETEVEYFQNSP